TFTRVYLPGMSLDLPAGVSDRIAQCGAEPVFIDTLELLACAGRTIKIEQGHREIVARTGQCGIELQRAGVISSCTARLTASVMSRAASNPGQWFLRPARDRCVKDLQR